MAEKKLKSFHIEKFRHLKDVNFNLGKRLTIIAGGNGTGKTSILGLMGHIFTYKKHKTLFNQAFETQFSDIFRFSKIHDKGGEHKYSITFSDNSSKKAESRETIEKRAKRFRIDVGERRSNSGKEEKPVIYLGLKRLIPLAQEEESSITVNTEDKLTDEYKTLYKKFYNNVFATSLNISPIHTKSPNKENYFPTTDNYDEQGISAGQDNIGQIILSLISFKHIKENDPDYEGGILIVDELDATLYPAAQTNLLELLLKESENLKLQIIFTTHSTDILNYIFAQTSSHFKHHTEFVYLDNSSGTVEVLQGSNILSKVVADLNHLVAINSKPKKINVYFEDNEGKIFFNNLIKGSDINKKIKAQNVSLGAGNYINLLRAKFPEFNNSLIILDGDFRDKLEKRFQKKVIFLPGTIRPESLIMSFLDSLSANDVFWGPVGGYTKRVFTQSCIGVADNREQMKRWFNKEKKHWGNGCSKLLKRWKELNPTDINIFSADLKKKINLILD